MDGTKDAGIAAAPTEVGIEPLANFGVGGPGSPFQQGNRGKDHARGAITALEGLFVQERLLDGVELPVAGQPLDGEDGTAGGLFDREGACVFAVAIHEHGAGAALAFAAAVLGAGEFEVFAEDLQERSVWFGSDRVALAVDGEFKLAFHGSIPASRGPVGIGRSDRERDPATGGPNPAPAESLGDPARCGKRIRRDHFVPGLAPGNNLRAGGDGSGVERAPGLRLGKGRSDRPGSGQGADLVRAGQAPGGADQDGFPRRENEATLFDTGRFLTQVRVGKRAVRAFSAVCPGGGGEGRCGWKNAPALCFAAGAAERGCGGVPWLRRRFRAGCLACVPSGSAADCGAPQAECRGAV